MPNMMKTGQLKANQTLMVALAEQDATGASQSIAHGLGYTPTMVWISPSQIPLDGNAAYALGTHDATNLQVSAYSDMKFLPYAY